MTEAMIFGAAIGDVLVRPVPEDVSAGSTPVERIQLSLGGDALNESTVLARLGHRPSLVTVLGADGMADTIRSRCEAEGIDLRAAVDAQMDTGINVVLVSANGERRFLTNPNGSLRRLGLNEILPQLETQAFAQAKVVCLASMFVSPMLNLADTEALFARVKAAGKVLCADSTKRKNGETLEDARNALRYLDYFFPNYEEAQLLTGAQTPDAVADALLEAGVKNVALKLGGKGCLLKNARERWQAPTWPVARCVDTTGAGDTFAGAMICALLEGEPLVRCGAFANATASLCVEQLGATSAALDRAEIARRRDWILGQM